MAWTSPRTWTPGELVTAALMNAHVRDNENVLRSGELDALDVSGASAFNGAVTFGDGAGDDITMHASIGFVGAPAFKPGSSTTVDCKAVGVRYKDGSSRSNLNAGETDANSVSIKGGTLSADGDTLEVNIGGTFANNGATKTIKLYFGATSVTLHSGTNANVSFQITVWIRRSGATAQIVYGNGDVGGTHLTVVRGTPGETLSGDVTLKTTLQGTTTADLTIDYFSVKTV